MKVAIYGLTEAGLKGARFERGDRIGNCLADGFKKLGIEYSLHSKFTGVCADVALGYGWIHELRDKVFSSYKQAGKHFVFFDLGYWNRSHKGSYRIGVDDWDTADNMLRGCSYDRFRSANIKLRNDWNPDNRDIMIVGMSDKAAPTHGYKFMEWENRVKDTLEKKLDLTRYRVYIRAKPKGKDAAKIAPIDDALKSAYYVVSHHSNVAVDALIAGVPFSSVKGVGRCLSPVSAPPDFVHNINFDDPYFPDEHMKIRLLNDIAYAQWTTDEMSKGLCWQHIEKVLKQCA